MKLSTPADYALRYTVIFSLIAGLLFFGPIPVSAAPAAFNESGGMVVFEAENYHAKIRNGVPRDFYTFPTSSSTPKPDPDGPHTGGAGNGKYLEILPDNRVTHDDPLQKNVNFFDYGSNAPQVHYNVRINSGGRYYVWVRAYSTGTEDNGVHVGYDGSWPTSGKAMQWCSGKNAWTWSSARRVPDNHCGVRNTIYLDLSAGNHTIKLGQREDGFEFDRIIMVKDRYYTPSGVGPAESKRTDGTGGSSGGGTTPTNSAPNAYAGPDATINLSDTLNLNGSASDDGLPNGTLSSYWGKLSGPGSVNIANPSAIKTTAKFGATGFYVLQLTVSDGQYSASDKIGVNVGGTTTPTNQPPSVNAGPDQTITLPGQAALSGSASDDGRPNNTIISTWSKYSGPGTVSIGNPSALKTTANFSGPGFYVLTLSVSDGALTRSDKIGIQVNDQDDDPDDGTPPGGGGSSGAYMQSGGDEGFVVMEAENFNDNISKGNHYWSATTSAKQYSGDGAMHAEPDQGERISKSYASNSPNLRFAVDFIRTGRHYLWARCYAGGDDNSLHAGINGQGPASAKNITVPVRNAWVWTNMANGTRAYLDISGKGTKMVDIWMREDGLMLDKILLTTDPAFVPTGLGPDESAYSDGGTGGGSGGESMVFEAEDFNTAKSTASHYWEPTTAPGGFSGDGAVRCMPDSGDRVGNNYVNASPRLSFSVNIDAAGVYYVWLRGRAYNNGNSVHAGLDGGAVSTAKNITFPVSGAYAWSGRTVNGSPARLTINRTGTHTIEVWMREDGFVLDKILLTTDPDYVP
jgi:hypothetical protein